MSKGVRLLFEVAEKSDCGLKINKHDVKEVLKSWHNWISVKDRLPDEDGYYLIYASWLDYDDNVVSTIIIRLFQGGEFLTHDLITKTHWMPLPEPPEVDNA